MAMDSAEYLFAAFPVLAAIANLTGKIGTVFIKRLVLSAKIKEAKRNAAIIAAVIVIIVFPAMEDRAMLTKLLFVVLAIAAGVAVACQGATNQGLFKATGIGPALIINSLVALTGVICLWFATGAPTNFFPDGTPWTSYLGGVFGFIMMAAIPLVFSKLGAAYSVALIVFGQCVAALIIDQYGLMAMERNPATLLRVIGILLVVGGVAVLQFSRGAATAPL
jgi:bacterial/archaeal transporter family-2 protein